MRLWGAHVILCLGLVCGACGAPHLSTSGAGARAWSAPGWSPFYGAGPGLDRPDVACDRYGRCWRVGPSDRFAHRDHRRQDTRPPGWADKLPGTGWDDDRFVRPGSKVVCDRATSICYKRGRIDKTETERGFGERAGDRADDVRDRLSTGRAFVPERGVACDWKRRVCLEDGDPDRRLTRRYFGRGAARALDEEALDESVRPGRQRSGRKPR